MDDFTIANLSDSRNEYSTLLINKIMPCVLQGFFSIFNEAKQLCINNDEDDKYLMTFQNLLVRIPKWSQEMIEKETARIIEKSECAYLEDLLTCVHITYLKILSNIRVGDKQKKIDMDIPELSTFIHKVYIQCARNIYMNVYLFQNKVELEYQKNLRELQLIIQDSILQCIRENMPVEHILRAYLDETVEETEEIIEKTIEPESKDTGIELKDEVIEERLPEVKEADSTLESESKSVGFGSSDQVQEYQKGELQNQIVNYMKDTNENDGPSNPNTTFYDDDDDEDSDDDMGTLQIGNSINDKDLGIESLDLGIQSLDIKEQVKNEVEKDIQQVGGKKDLLKQLDDEIELLS